MSPGLAASLASLAPNLPAPYAPVSAGGTARGLGQPQPPPPPPPQPLPQEAPQEVQAQEAQHQVQGAQQPQQAGAARGASQPAGKEPQGPGESVLPWYRGAVGRMGGLLRQLGSAQAETEAQAARAALSSAVDELVEELHRLAAGSRWELQCVHACQPAHVCRCVCVVG